MNTTGEIYTVVIGTWNLKAGKPFNRKFISEVGTGQIQILVQELRVRDNLMC